MSDQRRWAARYQFLDELWHGRDRIVFDPEIEQALQANVEGSAGELIARLLPDVEPDARVWMSLTHERRAASLARARSGTVFVGLDAAAEIATDVLIIEDETFIAMDLEGLVETLGHRVLGVARTHSAAVTLAKAKRPGLILADIQLADGSSGLDAVNELLRSFEVPVIFITAYPERFLTGERPEPAFLIAKPYQPATVSAVISQALFFERKARRPERRAG